MDEVLSGLRGGPPPPVLGEVDEKTGGEFQENEGAKKTKGLVVQASRVLAIEGMGPDGSA